MSYLLDTNICSAVFRRPALVAHRMIQYGGGLYISTVVLGELLTWAYCKTNPGPILDVLYNDLLTDVAVLVFDERCALEYGLVRAEMLKCGLVVGDADLMIAATALAHDLTLVTNNTSDFVHVPRLRLVDWLTE